MPSKFGAPSKHSVSQLHNKINVNVLSRDEDGQLTESVSSIILNNIATYLSRYRMINDYVIVKPAEIINVGFEISVLVKSGEQVNVIPLIVSIFDDEFSEENMDLGKNYLMGGLIKRITQIDGVLNINYIKAYNKTGIGYSSSMLSSDKFLNTRTNEINLSDGAIKVDGEQILQIKSPESDISVIPVTQNTEVF
jgi:hypothetical protein